MQNIIAVFSSRNYAMQFATILRKLGINNKIKDTPRELSSSCGISVIFESQYLGRAKNIIGSYKLMSHVKLYIISGDLFKKYLPIKLGY